MTWIKYGWTNADLVISFASLKLSPQRPPVARPLRKRSGRRERSRIRRNTWSL